MTELELAELRSKITHAEKQYHALMTGTLARVFVDQNGERVEFAAANASKLYAYIGELKSQLPGVQRVRNYTKPIGFMF